MPFAAIAPIIGAIAAAGSAGLGIYEATNQPSAPKPPTGPQPPSPTQSNAVKTAVGEQAPDIVAQTGGSVSPAYTLALSQLLSGAGNTPGAGGSAQSAINNLFGLGAGATTTGVPSLTNPTSMGAGVANFQPAGISGGSGGIVDEGLSNLFQGLGG